MRYVVLIEGSGDAIEGIAQVQGVFRTFESALDHAQKLDGLLERLADEYEGQDQPNQQRLTASVMPINPKGIRALLAMLRETLF